MNRPRQLIATTTLAIGALTIGACNPIAVVGSGTPAQVETPAPGGENLDPVTCWDRVVMDRSTAASNGVDVDADCVDGNTLTDKHAPSVTCNTSDGTVRVDVATAKKNPDLTDCTPTPAQ